MNKPKLDLSKFCSLVRGGQIPHKEVQKLMDKWSMPPSELKELFNKILETARQTSDEVSKHDKKLGAEISIIIAGFSHQEDDIEKAILAASSLKNDSLKSQLLAGLVKTLAQAKNFNSGRAWKIISKIPEPYWKAWAGLEIYRKTKLVDDHRRINNLVDHIRNPESKKEILAEIEHAYKSQVGHKAKSDIYENLDVVTELVQVMVDLNDLDRAHENAKKIGSAQLRIKVLSLIVRALKDQINE